MNIVIELEPGMGHNFTTKIRIKFLILILFALLCHQAHATDLDFDDLSPGTQVTDQFRDYGVRFNQPFVTDLNQYGGSGNVLQPCYSQEFCSIPVEMTFDPSIGFLSIRAGMIGPSSLDQRVSLTAYDVTGQVLTSTRETVPSGDGLEWAAEPLEVTDSAGSISRAVVTFVPPRIALTAAAVNVSIINDGLVVDDLHFERELDQGIEILSVEIESFTASPESPQASGTVITFIASANGTVDQPPSYSFFLDGQTVQEPSPDPRWIWTPSARDLGSNNITVVVTDSRGGYDSRSLTFDVRENRLPVITAIQADPPSPHEPGDNIAFIVDASDPEGDPLQFMFLLDGIPQTDWTPRPSWFWSTRDAVVGNYSIEVRVRDVRHGDSYNSYGMIYTLQRNLPPRIISFSADTEGPVSPGSFVSFSAVAEDPEDDPMQFRFLVDGKPATPWGDEPVWSWRAIEDPGEHQVEVQVRDTRNPEIFSSWSLPMVLSSPITPNSEISSSSYDLDWVVIIAGWVGLIGVGLYLWAKKGPGVRKPSGEDREPQSHPRIRAKGHPDAGHGEIGPQDQPVVRGEVGFRTSADHLADLVVEGELEVLRRTVLRENPEVHPGEDEGLEGMG